MIRVSRGLIPIVAAVALLAASASVVQAQMVCYQPAPVVAVAPVTSYYAPAPVTSYYAPAPVASYYAPAPVMSYYAPAPVVSSYYAAPAGVTTYRYGLFGRLRSVSSYYGAPAPVYSRYGYYYP